MYGCVGRHDEIEVGCADLLLDLSVASMLKKNGWTIKTTTSCVRIVGTVAATQISLEDKKLTSFYALDTCFLV